LLKGFYNYRNWTFSKIHYLDTVSALAIQLDKGPDCLHKYESDLGLELCIIDTAIFCFVFLL